MTDVNIPLLRKAVEWVEEQDALPEETRTWYQGAYVVIERWRVADLAHDTGCGTAYCLAGYVASQVDPNLAESSAYVNDDGDYVSTNLVASEILGLPYDHNLFNGGNDAETIRRLAEEYAGEKL